MFIQHGGDVKGREILNRPRFRKIMNGEMFEMRVSDVFEVVGQGAVLAGRVTRGRVRLGDQVVVKSPSREVRSKVAGLERDRQFISTASAGEEIALLVRNLDLSLLPDAFEISADGHRKPLDLLVQTAPARGWRFWAR